ncbi:MAG: protein-tyrosine phosphatase-like protein [Benjaminiella poitrasii]|nr:MAG: protein-tyrosine phosphatase-like protein [Benjaminiella poitrasii]
MGQILCIALLQQAVNLFGFMTGWSWYNRIDDLIILGALPTPTLIKELHQRKNVNTIINLCAEFPGYEKLYSELNIKQIRLETNDFTMPSLDAIHKGIDEIISIKNKQQASPENNNTIYLHCKAGRGRSAAIAFCYLLRIYDLNLAECQKVLIEKRIQVDKDLYKKAEIKTYYEDLLSDIDLGKYTRKPL